MSSPDIVIAIHDNTSFKCLKPIADYLDEYASIEYLKLDSFFNSKNERRDVHIPQSELDYPFKEAEDYIRIPTETFKYYRGTEDDLPRAVIHKLVMDHAPGDIPYYSNKYLEETQPDAFICGVDQFPMIKSLIEACDEKNITTAAVQHGTYERALDFDKVEDKPLFPNFSDGKTIVEQVKRHLGWKYGLTFYCHPNLDYVFTLGDFFTNRIGEFRELAKTQTNTNITTTGSPEYDTPISEYTDDANSILFLSQQQYEESYWSWEEQQKLVEMLVELDQTTAPVTVRPHPKDSQKKLNVFDERLAISNSKSLSEDIGDSDFILTINSTAIFEGVRQGKPCGVLQLPWFDIKFEPYVDEHIIQVEGATLHSENEINIGKEAKKRTSKTQREYLKSFCYSPQIDPSSKFNSSTEFIGEKVCDITKS